ncbi:MAG TPA: AraC family transcriptional regulator [Actinobacteria bacterium]|jgi:AraC-like DNA-binding protein|nr:AraC family transcriptional regulator [Actinomycetota bacterium]
MATEAARYWRHAAVPGVDLLRARFVTHRYGRHAHETYTFGVIESGVEEFDYGGRLLRAGRGAVALLDPDVVHTGQAGAPEGWTYRVLYPEVALVRSIAAELGWRGGTPSFPDTVLYDARTAAALRAAHLSAERGDRLASSSLLRSALAAVLSAHSRPGAGLRRSTGSRAPAAVAAARELITSRLADPPALDELAAATGLSPFALLRAFRAETGLPPHAYLNQLRVRQARALLDLGLGPAEVAARTGFADQAHLTRHFKRVVGVPPGAYQRERLAAAGPTADASPASAIERDLHLLARHGSKSDGHDHGQRPAGLHGAQDPLGQAKLAAARD